MGGRRARRPGAHPRSRGENGVRPSRLGVARGSSPLTRGKRYDAHGGRDIARLIPAHAGKTQAVTFQAQGHGAHPRSRGENALSPRFPASTPGSSPLTRGKRVQPPEPDQRRGLIPAHAGKTGPPARGPRPPAAHPRSRGENDRPSIQRAMREGSSPLTRGKPRAVAASGRGMRLIPAHAGKTWASRRYLRTSVAHPRSRGENTLVHGPQLPEWGSSPLTRGKLFGFQHDAGVRGLIPAHAGKTNRSPDRLVYFGAHPRSRGENDTGFTAEQVAEGSSPLTRGKRGPCWEGPRRPNGSSPLTRGKPARQAEQAVGPGLIPAHAGKTMC